jgi:hypothetical protein
MLTTNVPTSFVKNNPADPTTLIPDALLVIYLNAQAQAFLELVFSVADIQCERTNT